MSPSRGEEARGGRTRGPTTAGFEPELRRLAGRLDLPEPARSRFLLELRSDLEDLASSLRAEGESPAGARAAALEALLPSAVALAELETLHRPLYRRLADRFSRPERHRLERLLLLGLTVAVLGGSLAALARFDLLIDPSGFLWPILGLAAAVAAAGGSQLFHLYVAGGGGPGELRRGLPWLPALAALALAVGFGGAVVDLYLVAGRLAADASAQGRELLAWLRQDAAMLASSLIVASGAGLLWLIAVIRIARIERTEAEALGLYTPDPGRSE